MSLGDCHVHMILDAIYYRDAIDRHRDGPVESYIRKILEAYARAGVTYVRDGGDTCGVGLLASELAPEYGIEYRMPVFAIHRQGRYGKIVGFPFRDREEFTELMNRAEKSGADFIKIMVSGILDFHEVGRLSCDPLPGEEIRELVDRVHDRGMAVMLHINGKSAMMAAIEAGADSLEHGFYMDEECCSALAEHRETIWIPSISPVANQLGSGRFPDEVLEAITKGQQASVAAVVKAGGRIALGSDAGAWHVPHVKGIEDEFDYLKQALISDMGEEQLREMLAENEEWIRRRFRR